MLVALAVLIAAQAPKQPCESLRKNARFSAYFERVDLEKLVQTVSDATCKTFVLGENVRGKISIVGPENGHTSLDADQFYAVFLSALDANGFTVTGAGRFLRIVEKGKAKGTPIALLDEPGRFPTRDEMVTKVYRAKHADLEPLRNVLAQFVSAGADIVAFPPDVLIVNEVGSNLERLERIFAALDVEKKPAEELRVLNVRYADAQQLADQVSRVLGPKQPKPGEVLSLTADDRSNRIVLVASPALAARAVELIDKLDIALPGDGRAHVYKLAHADAKEIAANLETVVQAGRGKGAPGQQQTEVKITANESLNALLIVASAGEYQSMVEIIRELDVPRRQVFIETVVMEVNVERNDELGVAGHVVTPGVPIAIGSEPQGAPSSLDLRTLTSGLLLGTQGPTVKALSELGLKIPQFGLALQALQTTSDVNVMSTPHILTTDNKEAEISVGERIPFQTGVNPAAVASLLTAGGAANPAAATAFAGSVTRERVELKLIVKPHIGEGDNIRLEVNQSAEELSGPGNGLGPTTSTRTQKTSIVVKDADTVVLGGIMQDRVIEGTSKTPVLGDVPLLGHLFRHTFKKKIKVNLLVFLTPHVIRDSRDFQRLADAKMAERKRAMEQIYGPGALGGDVPADYSRKPGPLFAMERAAQREAQRPENGGGGAPDERLISPAE